MNTHTFTFIIGYRHRIDRFNNLKRTLDWINGFAGVDVILVEQDTHSKISHLPLKARQVFLKSNKPYNKAWGFNVGTKLSKSNVIVFSDLGVIMDPNQFIEGLKLIEKYEADLTITSELKRSKTNPPAKILISLTNNLKFFIILIIY